MSIRVSIRAHPRYLVVTDACALVLIELLLFAVGRARSLLSPLAFVLLGLAALAGFGADVGIWFRTGIRAAEASEDELTIFSGPRLSPRSIAKASIARMEIRRVLGISSVRLRTKSGLRVRLTENAFPREEFRRFLAVLDTWVR